MSNNSRHPGEPDILVPITTHSCTICCTRTPVHQNGTKVSVCGWASIRPCLMQRGLYVYITEWPKEHCRVKFAQFLNGLPLCVYVLYIIPVWRLFSYIHVHVHCGLYYICPVSPWVHRVEARESRRRSMRRWGWRLTTPTPCWMSGRWVRRGETETS